MTLIITEPIKTVNGLLTKALAAETQLLYQVQRQDFEAGNITTASGYAQVYIFGGQADSFAVGDLIFLSEPNKYTGLFNVRAWDSGTLQLQLETPYIGDETAIYVNNISGRPNYRLSADVLSPDGVPFYDEKFSYIPSQAGVARVDLGGVLTSFMKPLGLLSQEYYLEIEELWEGKQDLPDQPFTTSSDAGASQMLCTGFADTSVFTVGDSYNFNFDSAGYTDGVYQIEAIQDASSVIIDTPFLGSSGGIVSALSSVTTTTLQAVLASKQLLSVGGANMWEYLLVAGVSEEFSGGRFPEDLFYIETDNGLTPWTNASGGRLIFEFSDAVIGNEGSNEIALISEFVDNPIYPKGSIISYEFSFTFNVENFVSAGDLRLDFIIRDSLGSNVAIFNETYKAVTADQGYQNYLIKGSWQVPEEGMSRLRFRLNKIGGQFTSFFNCDGTFDPVNRYIDLRVTEPADLLTKYKNPLMWKDWNRTACFLIDSEYINRVGANNILSNSTDTDINKTDIAGGLNIEVDYTVNNVIIVPVQFQDLANAAFVKYRVLKTGDGTELSKPLYYKVEQEPCNPICLDWINSIGGIEQHVFQIKSTLRIEHDQGIVAERPITTDIEFITRTKQRFAKAFRQRLVVGTAGLTLDQLLALQEIKATESLRVYLSKDGANYIDAIVINTFSSNYQGDDQRHKFSVEIEFPDNFIFEEGKLY